VDAGSTGGSEMPEPGDAAVAESRRWLRDMGALLALPAMWVDHEPIEIATGLLSVLFSILRLDGAYARFDAPQEGGRALVSWRPSGPRLPVELGLALEGDETRASGMTTIEIDVQDLGPSRVACLPLALPWETGLVLVSSGRSDFPTAMETHLLRVAVSQAAIAIHTARRLADEHAARFAAEAALREHSELLRSLLDDIGQSFESISRRVQDAAGLIADVETSYESVRPRVERTIPIASSARADTAELHEPLLHLTRREIETLGLLAQGLSNKEIAGLMWLSDRTVERHITSLYRKIGVARRSEATAYALRHGFA